MTKRSMPKLLDEPPISLYPSLAVAFGNVNLAIIFQQLHFLMNVAETAQNNYVHVDGRWWVYNSYTEWKDKYFQWLGVSTLKALFGVLEEKGLVLSRQGVKDKFDRRKWYTINYEAYEQFIQSNGQNLAHEQRTESSQSESQQMSRDNKESETPYSETTQKNSPKPPKGAGKPKSYPSGYALAKWTDELIAQFSDEYSDGLTALLSASGLVEMYPTIKNMPRRDAVKYIEALRELTRLGCPPAQFESLWVYTRTMLNWRRNTPTPLDMVDQYTAWRQSRNPQLTTNERAERDKRLLAANGIKEIING